MDVQIEQRCVCLGYCFNNGRLAFAYSLFLSNPYFLWAAMSYNFQISLQYKLNIINNYLHHYHH